MPSEPVEGLVAAILNERELAINIGSEHGVSTGMRFAVLSKSPFEVRDPITNEILGVLDREKVRVQATYIDLRMSICSTYETKTIGGGFGFGYTSIQSALDLFEPRQEIPVTLRVTENDMPAPLTVEESYIEIGDRVREILDPLDKR